MENKKNQTKEITMRDFCSKSRRTTGTQICENHFVCHRERCKKVFSEKENLKAHLKTHTPEKPYDLRKRVYFCCCGKKFKSYKRLHDHQLSHFDQKCDHFKKCKVCDLNSDMVTFVLECGTKIKASVSKNQSLFLKLGASYMIGTKDDELDLTKIEIFYEWCSECKHNVDLLQHCVCGHSVCGTCVCSYDGQFFCRRCFTSKKVRKYLTHLIEIKK